MTSIYTLYFNSNFLSLPYNAPPSFCSFDFSDSSWSLHFKNAHACTQQKKILFRKTNRLEGTTSLEWTFNMLVSERSLKATNITYKQCQKSFMWCDLIWIRQTLKKKNKKPTHTLKKALSCLMWIVLLLRISMYNCAY